jgi:uncharacterized coiled-coil protein SlyX
MAKKKKTSGGAKKPAKAETSTAAVTPGAFINPVINPRPLPPIYFNIFPSIQSLSPPGAVVGGSDFTLTVLGSNFGAASTVTWNQSPRTTTTISTTQLNATIAAADIAAIQTVSVVVSNQGAAGAAPVLSNSVAFNVIPDISAIISQFQAISDIPAALLADLQTYVTLQQANVDRLTTQVSTDQNTAAGLNSQIATLQTTVAQQQTEINTLTAQLAATKVTTASPFDVAQSFKTVVDQIRRGAQSAGGVQTTVSSLNVQLKSLISMQAATSTAPVTANLIFPDPTALPDPQHLSTLSFAFGAIPNLSSASTIGPTPSPAMAPAPAPAPAATPAPAPAPAAAPARAAESAGSRKSPGADS